MTGHRTYLKAGEKLITTRPVKPPRPFGHRQFIDPKLGRKSCAAV